MAATQPHACHGCGPFLYLPSGDVQMCRVGQSSVLPRTLPLQQGLVGPAVAGASTGEQDCLASVLPKWGRRSTICCCCDRGKSGVEPGRVVVQCYVAAGTRASAERRRYRTANHAAIPQGQLPPPLGVKALGGRRQQEAIPKQVAGGRPFQGPHELVPMLRRWRCPGHDWLQVLLGRLRC